MLLGKSIFSAFFRLNQFNSLVSISLFPFPCPRKQSWKHSGRPKNFPWSRSSLGHKFRAALHYTSYGPERLIRWPRIAEIEQRSGHVPSTSLTLGTEEGEVLSYCEGPTLPGEASCTSGALPPSCAYWRGWFTPPERVSMRATCWVAAFK